MTAEPPEEDWRISVRLTLRELQTVAHGHVPPTLVRYCQEGLAHWAGSPELAALEARAQRDETTMTTDDTTDLTDTPTPSRFEFYETPTPFTRWLFQEVAISGRLCEPCAGSMAIVKAAPNSPSRQWVTNDIDPRWAAAYALDARQPDLYEALGDVDWHVSNPPFTPAVEIIDRCLAHARVGVAMHLRASIHEVLKTGVRRTWLAERPPTGILWLPRYAYQRSPTTGKWTTDSVCACWVVWIKGATDQFIKYAPASMFAELEAEQSAYRERMDRLTAMRAA